MNQSNEVLLALQQCFGRSTVGPPIALHEPDFSGTEAWTYLRNCLDTGWVSTAGKWVSRFEKDLCAYTGAKHVVAVTNGTVALRLALHVVGVNNDDEVLLPPFSFVATANAVAHLGAIPHFVDIDPAGLGMDPGVLDARLNEVAERRDGSLFNRITGRRLAAILPVHVFGHPARMKELRLVAQRWNLPLVEDAAEALGSWFDQTHCGLFGDVGILSFNGNKLITTGGGGALMTNNAELAECARHLSTTAKLPHPWDFEHDSVGWNDRLPNLNAALGVAQLEDLERRLKCKRELAERYLSIFRDVSDVELITEPQYCRSNYWLISLRFVSKDRTHAEAQRLEVLKVAHSMNLFLRPAWKPLHKMSMFSNSPHGLLSVAEDQASRVLSLPSSPQLLEVLNS